MADYKTTYVDKAGKKHEGTVKDGKTYTATGERVPVGSLVNTAGGQYIMTDKGGVAYDPTKSSFSGLNETGSSRRSSGGSLSSLNNNTSAPQYDNPYAKKLLENSAKLTAQYKNAAKAKYDELMSTNVRDRLAAGRAYQQQYGNYLNDLRAQRADAIQSGASKGMQAAQEITSMLGLGGAAANIEEQYANKSLDLANQRGTALAEADIEAILAQNEIYSTLAAQDLQKYGVDVGLFGQMYGADVSAAASRYSADQSLIGTKYSSDNSLAGTKYSADRSFEGTKYSADKSFEGTKYSSDNTLKGTLASLENARIIQQRGFERDDNLQNTQYNNLVATYGKTIADMVRGGMSLMDALDFQNTPDTTTLPDIYQTTNKKADSWYGKGMNIFAGLLGLDPIYEKTAPVDTMATKVTGQSTKKIDNIKPADRTSIINFAAEFKLDPNTVLLDYADSNLNVKDFTNKAYSELRHTGYLEQLRLRDLVGPVDPTRQTLENDLSFKKGFIPDGAPVTTGPTPQQILEADLRYKNLYNRTGLR